MEYLEKMRMQADPAAQKIAPWEDVSLKPLPDGTPAQDVVGEHLRVFINECTWRWAREKSVDYEEAKTSRTGDASFEELYNAATFETAMLSRGVAAGDSGVRWEVQTKEGKAADDSQWEPYDDHVQLKLAKARRRGQATCEVSLGPKQWRYTIDLVRNVQRNYKTTKERSIRCVEVDTAEGGASKGGRLAKADLDAAIAFFVDMCTLPPAPKGAQRADGTGSVDSLRTVRTSGNSGKATSQRGSTASQGEYTTPLA